MATLSLVPGLLTVSDKEIFAWTKWLLNHIHIPFNPFDDIPQEDVSKAVNNLVKFLLADNISDGIGKGGWGYSDKKYIQYMQGEEDIQITSDSVSTTVVVADALYKYLSLQGTNSHKLHCEDEASNKLWNVIVQRLSDYLACRWDRETGHGGVLIMGREGDPTLAPRYRHTAFLLRLWALLPGYYENIEKTANNLIQNFNAIDWEKEKIATHVAAYKAFDIMQGDSTILGVINKDKVLYYKKSLRDKIVAKYDNKFNGWTSKENPDRSRQLYTLFVLVEMAGIYNEPASELSQKMNSALNTTVMPPWMSVGQEGLPLKPDGPVNINTSSLLVSALLRKPSNRLSTTEKRILTLATKNLIYSLSDKWSENINEAYSWTLGYFLADLCQCTKK